MKTNGFRYFSGIRAQVEVTRIGSSDSWLKGQWLTVPLHVRHYF